MPDGRILYLHAHMRFKIAQLPKVALWELSSLQMEERVYWGIEPITSITGLISCSKVY
jgi:hypothetical protein